MRPSRSLVFFSLLAVTLLVAGLAVQRTSEFRRAVKDKVAPAKQESDLAALSALAERHAVELLALFGAGMLLVGFLAVKFAAARPAGDGRGVGFAWTDPATGLASRERLLQYLLAEILRSRRYQIPFTLAVFVPDGLQDMDRRLGRNLLPELGKYVHGSVRTMDAVFGLGNGRFALLLPHTGLSGGFILAERLRHRISEHRFCESCKGGPLTLTASFGIAEVDVEQDQPETLLARAEACVRRAQEQGKNRVS